MKNGYQSISHYGPGGRNCTCCGPAPAKRRVFDRHIRKRDRQVASREIIASLSNQ